MPAPPAEGHLLLVGAGHAHLVVLESLARRPRAVRATLIAPAPLHAYSGMVPGWIGGRYPAGDICVDLARLAGAAGVQLRLGSAARIDPSSRTVGLVDGDSVGYDVLSVAIGAGGAGAERPGVRGHALFVRPIDEVLAIVPALERTADGSGAVVVVGGGAAGVELALAARQRLRRMGRLSKPVALIEAGDRVLADRSPAAADAATEALARNGVGVLTGRGVGALEPGFVRLEGGGTVAADLVIWAAGAAAPPLIAESGLTRDDAGYLLVRDTLESVAHPGIFGAGDAVTLAGYPAAPKSGVLAVREGPVLRDNLLAALQGRPLPRRFRPPSRFLALLNTGDERAVLSYGSVAVTARWVMALKDRIDRRFMRRFQRLGAGDQAP